MKPNEDQIAAAEMLLTILTHQGNAGQVPYLRGLGNGAILIMSVLRGEKPVFIDLPEDPEAPDLPEDIQNSLDVIMGRLEAGEPIAPRQA